MILSKEAFGEKLIEMILERHPQAQIVERLAFGVKLTSPQWQLERALFFDQPYADYGSEPERIEAILSQWLQLQDVTGAEVESAASEEWTLDNVGTSILPILRHDSFLEATKQQLLSMGQSEEKFVEVMAVTKRLTRTTSVQYAIDLPQSTTLVFVMPNHRRRWALSDESALPTCRQQPPAPDARTGDSNPHRAN